MTLRLDVIFGVEFKITIYKTLPISPFTQQYSVLQINTNNKYNYF